MQTAFFIYDLLSDRWDGMTGTYLGKEWSSVGLLLDTFEVENRPVVIYLCKVYETLKVNYIAEEAEKKRKAEERKAKASSGKNFSHNVSG